MLVEVPKIDVPEDDEAVPPVAILDCPVDAEPDVPKIDVVPVLFVAVELPKIEDDDVATLDFSVVAELDVPKIPVLLASVEFPKIDVPEDDDEIPPVEMVGCAVAAVVAVVEPNTDLLGADKAVKGEGPLEELTESVPVGVTEAEETETVLLVPNTDELEAEVVIPPKTEEVVDVDVKLGVPDEICPKIPDFGASFPVVDTVLLGAEKIPPVGLVSPLSEITGVVFSTVVVGREEDTLKGEDCGCDIPEVEMPVVLGTLDSLALVAAGIKEKAVVAVEAKPGPAEVVEAAVVVAKALEVPVD